jgi:hypothetical protein
VVPPLRLGLFCHVCFLSLAHTWHIRILVDVFFLNTSNLAINVGRFFFLGGLTLLLDDLPDVHRVTFNWVQWLKVKAHNGRSVIQFLQFVLGLVTFYLFWR